MSSQRLLELYDRVADAPDAVERLRKFVLDLAVRGKLVEQDSQDEPASDLLKHIEQEKADLPNVYRSSPVDPVEDSALPFSLPNSWVWCQLGQISRRLHYGYTASASKSERDVRLLRITDIQNDQVNWDNVPGCVIEKKAYPKYALEEGDLLIARTGGTIGKTFLVSDVPVKCVFASYLIRVQPARALCAAYLKLFCGSGEYWAQLAKGSRGGGQPNVNGRTLGRMNVPLPPLLEQHRIIRKGDELMALLDRLETIRTQRESAKSRLLVALLSKVLEAPKDQKSYGRVR